MSVCEWERVRKVGGCDSMRSVLRESVSGRVIERLGVVI